MVVYDVPAYNTLPLISEVQPASEASLNRLASLAPIIQHQMLDSDVGFVLLHRHFNSQSGDLVIWSLNGDALSSLMRPLRQDIDIPILWMVNTSGELHALEYIDGSTLPTDKREKLLALEVSPAMGFLGRGLSFLGLAERFGISALPLVIGHNKTGARNFGLEASNPGARSSTLTLSSGPQQRDIDTLWVFRPDRGFAVMAGCTCDRSPPPPSPP